jgi:hypothetical protein
MTDLNLSGNNAKDAAAKAKQTAPALDPKYPWPVIAFVPSAFGFPKEITQEDVNQAAR